MDNPNVMYMNCRILDPIKHIEETSIIKMDCKNLVCNEVYWSRFKIIHIAIVENKDTVTGVDSDSSLSDGKIEDSIRGINIDDQENQRSQPVVMTTNDIMPDTGMCIMDFFEKKSE